MSHAWKYKFLDTVDALHNFFKDRSSSGLISSPILSTTQDRGPLSGGKRPSVKKIKRVVMILQPIDDPIPLTRAWCIFEVYATHKTGSEFHVAMTLADSEAFINKLTYENALFYRVLSNISKVYGNQSR